MTDASDDVSAQSGGDGEDMASEMGMIELDLSAGKRDTEELPSQQDVARSSTIFV
jgi:hypothetical protein